MQPRYALAEQAYADLLDISDYIAQDNRDAAARLVSKFEDAFEMLARQPRAGHARDDLRPGLRMFPVRRYVIAYHIVEDKECPVEIARVVHGARNLSELF